MGKAAHARAEEIIPEAPKSGTHLTTRRVELADVLDLLAAEAGVSSAFGGQLERAHDGTTGSADYVRARSNAEAQLLSRAAVVRCIDALAASANLFRTGEACVDIRRFAVRAKMVEGAAVVGVLRAYQPWAFRWPERGLAEVYGWARARNPALKVADPSGETSLAQAFRVGKARRARGVAALLLADAEVALHAFVEGWNRKLAVRPTPRAA